MQVLAVAGSCWQQAAAAGSSGSGQLLAAGSGSGSNTADAAAGMQAAGSGRSVPYNCSFSVCAQCACEHACMHACTRRKCAAHSPAGSSAEMRCARLWGPAGRFLKGSEAAPRAAMGSAEWQSCLGAILGNFWCSLAKPFCLVYVPYSVSHVNSIYLTRIGQLEMPGLRREQLEVLRMLEHSTCACMNFSTRACMACHESVQV